MCSSCPTGTGASRARSSAGRRRLRRAPGSGRRRPARPPRPAATSPRSRGSYRSHASSGEKKPLDERPWESGAALAALASFAIQEALHSLQCSESGSARRQTAGMLELFPDTARVEDGELALGGVRAAELAEEFGTPLVVYCEETLRARGARLPRGGAGRARRYGTKAFPNVALLRAPRRGGHRRGRVHARRARVRARGRDRRASGSSSTATTSRTRSCARAAEAGALVVLDAPDEVERGGRRRRAARARPRHAGHRRRHARARSRPATAARSSGCRRRSAGARSRGAASSGSTSGPARPPRLAARLRRERCSVDWLAAFASGPRRARLEPGRRRPRRRPRHPLRPRRAAARARRLVCGRSSRALRERLPAPAQSLIFEPGRSLVGRAGSRSTASASSSRAAATTYVAVDGGMSDNPRPQLYDARYTALLANRADEPPTGLPVAGKHCESGDVLIERAGCPRRGAATCSPCRRPARTRSRWLELQRRAAAGGGARRATARRGLIRRRETVDDLLRFEA